MKKFTTQKTSSKICSIKSYASIIVTCVAFCVCSIGNSFAKENSNSLLKKYGQDLKEVELYLNNIKNLTAKFIQETSEGSVVEGNFYLSRPGKMRIEYNEDPQILIIVNGSVLTYHDIELDEISHLSTNTTPASFLTRPNISFKAKDVEITNVKKTAKQLKVSVMKKNSKDAGEFSLIFDLNPINFIRMEVKNDLNQTVKVTLFDVDFRKKLSKSLFMVKNDILP